MIVYFFAISIYTNVLVEKQGICSPSNKQWMCSPRQQAIMLWTWKQNRTRCVLLLTVQQSESFKSNLLLAWQLLQPLRLYSQLLQSQHLAHLTPSVQHARIQSFTWIKKNNAQYLRIWSGNFSCRTSVAFKSASVVLWQSGTIILDSAKTLSCRQFSTMTFQFSQSQLHEKEKTTSVASCGAWQMQCIWKMRNWFTARTKQQHDDQQVTPILEASSAQIRCSCIFIRI